MSRVAPGFDKAKNKTLFSIAKTLRNFDRARQKPIINAIRRVLTSVKTDARGRIRERGIGRRIWGVKPKGLEMFVKRGRVEAFGDNFVGAITVHGIPAIIEKGGRIDPHVMEGRVFANKKTGFFARGKVHHPGGPVQKRTNVEDALKAAQPRFEAEIRKAMDEAMVEAQRDAAA